jgi:hypothetical protein
MGERIMENHKEQRIFRPEQECQQALPQKTYERPCLVEWGSLTELTQGERAANDDLPFDGGTQNE